MTSRPFVVLVAFLSAIAHLSTTLAFPRYASLGGLTERELAEIVPRLPSSDPAKPPGPLKYNGTKLVYDRAHPWKPLGRDDIRGPCPGLNTLASHGMVTLTAKSWNWVSRAWPLTTITDLSNIEQYLPRDGVATPAQIITAVQEGFNMQNNLARFVTYAAHIVDGNLVTDLVSIGGKTRETGPDPGAPAIVGGLNTHAVFEGDASMTRADFAFGDNHSLNTTLFNQFIDYSNRFGGGFYNLTVAQELRWQRIQESIATNPTFDFTSPRFFTAYAESTFPISFFVDGRNPVRALSIANATLFFKDSKFPVDFWRPAAPSGAEGIAEVFSAHPIAPGKNANGINSYTPDPTSADFSTFCLLYTNFVTRTVGGLYPNPKGVLKRNLIINLGYLYDAIDTSGCTELFPYGTL
ncbi:hypothetical protein D9611_011765 [Ephemerocybe angulata]|uniref:Heme haloperoxidase family profile domain-containing protein n=1 Tax=Ephemerocybe angulata TaxID=980116 RepID=A0A8H5FG73_9AGAR|nr:hypothetical protein D9611_011765 [Tulosesus angulatus]